MHHVYKSKRSKQANTPTDNNLSFVPKPNILSNIRSTFRYTKQLGKGVSCCVFKAQNIKNNKLYAIKELTQTNAVNLSLFCKEVKLLKKLHHPNILHYYNCYMDNKCYYIATEYCSGGTLLQKMIKMKFLCERQASQYIRVILSAVNYMHALDIVHSDLKAQNIVFDKVGCDGVLQIIDFGHSKIVKPDQLYDEIVGTVYYIPPEIIRPRTGRELKKSDMWSIGVLTYILVCGQPPFVGASNKEILANIMNKNKKLEYPKRIELSKSCKNFIESLLCHNIQNRLSAAKALKHKWICDHPYIVSTNTSNCNSATATAISLADDVITIECLSKHNHNNTLQGIIVNAMLSEMESLDKKILSKGIINMNRKLSNMDSSCVVNYLLLNSSPLFGANNAVEMQSQSQTNSDDEKIDWDCLHELDVDHILNAFEIEQQQKETEEEEIVVVNYENIIDELNEINCKQIEKDSNDKSISISRFRAIMRKSNVIYYDIDQIVNDLSDQNGQIPLHKISTYTKQINQV